MESQSDPFTFSKNIDDTLKDNYGILPLVSSQCDPRERTVLRYIAIKELNEEYVGERVLVRARLMNSRIKGKGGFLVLRDQTETLQACIFVTEGKVSKDMLKFVSMLRVESLIDIWGILNKAEKKVESCTKSNIEIEVEKIYIVVSAPTVLPFQMEDASRKVNPELEEDDYVQKKEEIPKEEENKKLNKKNKKNKKEEKGEKKDIVVKMNTRLDNRVLDLRVPTNQALFKIQSGICSAFRDYLDTQGFTEIHTPKLIAGASEGGSNVFKFKYFNNDACLAQSPQLYKQMCIIGDMKRVYEVGSVFRAENSMTSRHLCEFTGLDIEMEIKEHFFEVLDVISGLFYYIFETLNNKYKQEIDIIQKQYPFEPIVYSKDALKLHWSEGIKLLKDNGFKQDPNEDLDTENEKALGKLVKEKYKTDFYILYGYPKSARPFYTMPDPKDDNFTNSFDAFIRGEEVLSGAQRIHDHDLLLSKIKEKEIDPSTLKDYLDSFKLGAPPHGGAGLGMERVLKLFLGYSNVKKCVLFPRDPKRLRP